MISLITVSFNGAAVIRTALESVFAQKNARFEYIVVDGGSNDGTVDVIREFDERFRAAKREGLAAFDFRWMSERDRGMYDAINKGIALAKGDFIGILNADDYLDGDDVLARVESFIDSRLARDAGLDCVFGNVRFVKEFGGRTERVCFARFWAPWMLHWGYMPPHPAIFIRRTCFEKWGGYMPGRDEYRIAADCELLIRFFCRHRMSHRYMPVNTTVMRLGGVSTRDLNARRILNLEIVKGNRANGYRCWWPMLLPKYLIKVWEVILPRLGFYRSAAPASQSIGARP